MPALKISFFKKKPKQTESAKNSYEVKNLLLFT